MCLYLFYINVIYELREEGANRVVDYVFMTPLALFSVYFIGMETKQLFKEGPSYLLSIWNYLDFIPPIIMLVFIPLALNGYFDKLSSIDQNLNQSFKD